MHCTNTNNPVDFPKLSAVDRLWGEALDRAASETYTKMSYSQVLKVKQVFAQLIVQECLLKVNGAKIRGESMDELIERIKEDFGVEE